MAKPNLTQALNKAARSSQRPGSPANPKAPSASNDGLGTAHAVAPSRQGKKAIAGFFDPAVSRQLKQIGIDRDEASVQDLLREALNDLFQKYGKPPIA